MKLTHAYLIFSWSFLILNLKIPGASSGYPPWLNICGTDGKNYYAFDVPSCPQGYYFKTPISGFCACGHGVWQFKTDYCGKDIVIAADSGDCFTVNSAVRWVRHIGNKYDAFAEYYFVTDPSWDEIRSFRSSMSVAGYSVLGTISPRHTLSSCNEASCFLVAKSSDEVYNPSLQFPPLLFSNINQSDGYSLGVECPFYWYTDEQAYNGAVVKHGMLTRIGKLQNLNGTARSQTCKATCKVIPPIPYYNDTLDESDPLIAPNCSETDNNYKDLPGIMVNETHEQSIRMMLNHYDVVLKGKKSPQVNITEYEYFQTSRQIFEKVCPGTEAPPLLLRSLLRMFRLAVNESWTKYPYRQTGDHSEDARIKIGLAKCLSGANQKIEFVYNETTCPKEFLEAKMSWPGSVRNFSTGLPCNLQYNTSKYDYPTEVAWKMVMFVHYYCAIQFENAGFDHSRLEYKLRNLFNREIRHRWYKQGESANLMEHIFREYDLTKFKHGVDRCVAAARDSSPYRKWIWRPKYIQFCGATSDKNGAALPETRSKGPENSVNKEMWGGDAYCINSFTEPIVSGWTRSGNRCFAKPANPNCEREPPLPKLVLPLPTFVNPQGQKVTGKLEKCYKIVGDWMFEPGAELLCRKYEYGDTVAISKNLTQFDGKHCWSPFYQIAFLCENLEGLQGVLSQIFAPAPSGTTSVELTIPEGACNKSSPGQAFTDEDLKQCWRILGDKIFQPGNELICYQIDFGYGLEPKLPPPLPLPRVTFVDSRGAELEDPKQQRCYKRLGDLIFMPGNEMICCLTNNGKNVIHDPLTQFDGKKCFSAFYDFAYRCENEEILKTTGYPNLTDPAFVKPVQIVFPIKSEISMGLNLTDPDLKQCWDILGDIIYEKHNSLICYYIEFGKNHTAVTTTSAPVPTAVPNPELVVTHRPINPIIDNNTPMPTITGPEVLPEVTHRPINPSIIDNETPMPPITGPVVPEVTHRPVEPDVDIEAVCKKQVKHDPRIHLCPMVAGRTQVVCCDYTNMYGWYFPVQRTLPCYAPNVFKRFPTPRCSDASGKVLHEGFPKDDPATCLPPTKYFHEAKKICLKVPVKPHNYRSAGTNDNEDESRSSNANKRDGLVDRNICVSQVKYNPEFIECFLVNGDTQQLCCDYWEDGMYHPREKSLPCDPPNVFKDQPEPQCVDARGNVVHKGMPSDRLSAQTHAG